MADIGLVCRLPVFQALNLPPFKYNVGVDQRVVTSQRTRSNQSMKIEIDKNR